MCNVYYKFTEITDNTVFAIYCSLFELSTYVYVLSFQFQLNQNVNLKIITQLHCKHHRTTGTTNYRMELTRLTAICLRWGSLWADYFLSSVLWGAFARCTQTLRMHHGPGRRNNTASHEPAAYVLNTAEVAEKILKISMMRAFDIRTAGSFTCYVNGC